MISPRWDPKGVAECTELVPGAEGPARATGPGSAHPLPPSGPTSRHSLSKVRSRKLASFIHSFTWQVRTGLLQGQAFKPTTKKEVSTPWGFTPSRHLARGGQKVTEVATQSWARESPTTLHAWRGERWAFLGDPTDLLNKWRLVDNKDDGIHKEAAKGT